MIFFSQVMNESILLPKRTVIAFYMKRITLRSKNVFAAERKRFCKGMKSILQYNVNILSLNSNRFYL